MLLQTKAQLLYGVSKIMRQKTFILYEDSLHLCNKLKFGMADPLKNVNIDIEKPIANSRALTLMEKNDSLIEFQTSVDAPLFASLFDDNRTRLSERDKSLNELDESICSIIKFMSQTSSFDLPNSLMDTQLQAYYGNQQESLVLANTVLQNVSSMMETSVSNMEQSSNAYMNNNFLFPDNDLIGQDDGVDDDQDFTMNNDRVANSQALGDDSDFDFPYHSNINTASIRRHSANSYSPYASSNNTSSGHASSGKRPISSVNSRPPSLIVEEGSYDSLSTEMYSNIVPDESPIVVSEVPPSAHRPRCVRRMMMDAVEDTILPFSHYYQTEKVVRRDENLVEIGLNSKRERIDKIRDLIRLPSMKLNSISTIFDEVEAARNDSPFIQGEYAFFNGRSRHYKQRHYRGITTIDYARSIERPRRFDRHRDRSGSSSVSGGFMNAHSNSAGNISVRSSSDIPTPEMNNLDLGSDTDQMQQDDIHWQFNNQLQFDGVGNDFDDDNVDYGYLHFDQEFPTETEVQQEIAGKDCYEFLEILRVAFLDQEVVHLDDTLKSKSRVQVSKAFYYVLGNI
ncbi:MAG: hypothetical protein EXX96DRAFT_313191 [Benjaminiella poitrasii]|nr:MAG: hypothetical protein EXX96DRAFT_313191 [Benjaminiella poitrasii]